MNFKKIKSSLVVLGVSIINSKTVLAASDVSTVTAKVNQGLMVIQGVLTGIIVVVGVIAALKVIISKLPSLDDPGVVLAKRKFTTLSQLFTIQHYCLNILC